MAKLILLRHAKSSWDDPALPDFARPLNSRGQRDAPRMARVLRPFLTSVKHMWISPAKRTLETWERMLPHLPERPREVGIQPFLYACSAEELLQALALNWSVANDLLVLGHAPGLPDTVSFLTGSPAPAFPTCAFAVLEVPLPPDPWEGRSLCTHYCYPKLLVDNP